MIRAVLDTNVLVSAILAGRGAPRLIFEAWRRSEFILLTSLPLLDELDRVLRYEKIQGKYELGEDDIYAIVLLVSVQGEVVANLPEVDAITSDVADNAFLSCALGGQAYYIVSGDRHLLDLEEFKGVKIVTAREFARLLSEAK